MKAIVRYLDGVTETFEVDGVAINQSGLIMLMKGDHPLAMLVPQNIVGVYQPDGPSRIQGLGL